MSAPATVGYVLKMFPRFSETFVVNELLELERRGLPLVVYSLKRPPDGPRHAMLSRLRAEVVYLPESIWRTIPRVARAHAGLLRRSPRVYLHTLFYVLTRHNWAAIKRFAQAGLLVLDAERRGVCHLHAHFATSATRVSMLAARLSPDLGYSFTAHAKDIYLESQDADLLRDKMMEARFVVTVSDFNLRHLRELCGPEAASRVVRIYNGVDVGAFQAPPAAADRDPHTILCVARLVEKKGVGGLLEACARLAAQGTRFRCRIVGDGPLRAELERRTRGLELAERVSFLGNRPHEEVARELAAATVFALPCVVARDGNRDGLPTVILEAMASQVPVVSTRVTGIPEMLEHGVSGLLVDPGDVPGLARALADVLSDPRAAAAMGAAARQRILSTFALRRNAGELCERLRAVASDAVSGARAAAHASTLERDGATAAEATEPEPARSARTSVR